MVKASDQQDFIHAMVQKDCAHCGDSLFIFIEIRIDAIEHILERTQPRAMPKEQ